MRFLLLLALLAASGVQAAAIERFKSFVGTTQSARADFEQKVCDREAGFERIRMGLGSGGIEAMELADNFGQTTLLRFFNLVRNPKVDPAQFRFVPPKGVDVLGDQ